MEIQVDRQAEQESARIRLLPGESFVSETGAMHRTSDNITIAVTKAKRDELGLLDEMKRLLTGGDLFLSTYEVDDQEIGEIELAPAAGRLARTRIEGSWICLTQHYLGSNSTLEIQFNPVIPEIDRFLPGSALLRLTGAGELLVAAETSIVPITVRDKVTVSPDQIVAWDEMLQLQWMAGTTETSPPFLHFHGMGRLLLRSSNSTT